MARNPTQRYIDNEKSGSFLSNILNQTPVGVVEEIDIDLVGEMFLMELEELQSLVQLVISFSVIVVIMI